MSLNSTPISERIRIGIFGKRNAGKSSLINAMTGQNTAIVSDTPGTTTDPVSKTMELLPLGPVVITDTPGIDDEGELGEMRVLRAFKELNRTDIAILVADAVSGLTTQDISLLKKIQDKNIPYFIVFSKADLYRKEVYDNAVRKEAAGHGIPEGLYMKVSAATGLNIDEVREKAAAVYSKEDDQRSIVGDIIGKGDIAVLVVPIDKAAPKGRLILPQQQTIRNILDIGGASLVVRDTELGEFLGSLAVKPEIVITDSQVFGKVSTIVPEDIMLTSFSILFARYKGSLMTNVNGAEMLKNIKDGDRILISEGCTHHRQCGDIGTVKLPGLIRKYTGAEPVFEFTSGKEFPDILSDYKMIIHCGGCMLTEREMKFRIACAQDQGIPFTNYGIAIAYMNGILERSLRPFPEYR